MIVAIIGLGTFGSKTAISLAEKGVEVLAIDKNEILVEKIKDRVAHAVNLDVTDERSLRSVNISDVDTALVAIGDHIDMSIMATAMLRKLGVGRVISRATSLLHEHVLREIGASEIIKVEEDMGEIIAGKIAAPYILESYNFAAGYSIVEIKVGKEYDGKSILETRIKQNYSLNIVAIQRKIPIITLDGKSGFKFEVNDDPAPSDIIYTEDILALVGSDKNLKRLFSVLTES